MELWSVLIGAFSAILGSTITQIISWSLQKKTEEKKRTWSLEDVLRDKQIQIMEKRIREIEKLAGALSINFNDKRLVFSQYVTGIESSTEIPDFVSEVLMNTSKLQKEFYAITPMIISLDFKRGNLKELWEKATDLDNDLIHIITNEPAYPKTDGYDSKQTILAITKLKTEFNHSMAEFYDELDSLQISTIEEFIRFSSS